MERYLTSAGWSYIPLGVEIGVVVSWGRSCWRTSAYLLMIGVTGKFPMFKSGFLVTCVPRTWGMKMRPPYVTLKVRVAEGGVMPQEWARDKR